MNDFNNFSAPADSLGRILGVANGFSKYSDDMLAKMISDLGLSADPNAYRFCRDHYKANKLDSIKLDELYFIDGLVKASGNLVANLSITELYSDSKDMIDTYNDMLQKNEAVNGTDTPPLTLCTASRLYSEYAKSIGLAQGEENIWAQRSITDGTAFLLVTPADSSADHNDYLAMTDSFFASDTYRANALFSKKIDSRGIAFALCEVSSGIFADIYSIPAMPSEPELSHLVTEAHGLFIIATSKPLIPILSEEARKHGLGCTYFARTVMSDKFSLRDVGRISMQLDTSLILALGNGTRPSSFTLLEEPFVKTANALVDSVLPSVLGAAPLSRITVRSEYIFPESAQSNDSKNTALSAVLGAYRGLVELCVAETEPRISFASSVDTDIRFTSFSENKAPLPKTAEREAKVYLLSYNRRKNGLTEFSSFRQMCERMTKLIQSGRLIAAVSFSDSPEDAIKELGGNMSFEPENSATELISAVKGGFVFASLDDIRTAAYIGRLREETENTEKEPCDEL